jgi:hypothetical protein
MDAGASLLWKVILLDVKSQALECGIAVGDASHKVGYGLHRKTDRR